MSTCVAEIPGWDETYTTSLNYTLEELYEEGARMQEARLRAIGLPLDDIPRFPLPIDLPPRERGLRGITLMSSGYLGPKHNYRGPDEVSTEILFDQMRRSVDPAAVQGRHDAAVGVRRPRAVAPGRRQRRRRASQRGAARARR